MEIDNGKIRPMRHIRQDRGISRSHPALGCAGPLRQEGQHGQGSKNTDLRDSLDAGQTGGPSSHVLMMAPTVLHSSPPPPCPRIAPPTLQFCVCPEFIICGRYSSARFTLRDSSLAAVHAAVCGAQADSQYIFAT